METPVNEIEQTDRVELLSVRVTQPRTIGTQRSGEPVQSAIDKQVVSADSLELSDLNLMGDRQADLVNHGGPDKAVYVYPADHLPRWNDELRVEFGPGTFGENLTITGTDERAVRIGDVWAWGDALLQVSQPRQPCYKLAMISGQPAIGRHMVETGWTGWYLRVLRPGTVPVAGPILVMERHPSAVTVLAAHRAMLPETSVREITAVLAVESLAGAWSRQLRERLNRS